MRKVSKNLSSQYRKFSQIERREKKMEKIKINNKKKNSMESYSLVILEASEVSYQNSRQPDPGSHEWKISTTTTTK